MASNDERFNNNPFVEGPKAPGYQIVHVVKNGSFVNISEEDDPAHSFADKTFECQSRSHFFLQPKNAQSSRNIVPMSTSKWYLWI